jgi:hypothetical protein
VRSWTLSLLVMLTSVASAAPFQFEHQGRLLDGLGAPVQTTSSLTFSIYDAQGASTPLWAETHPTVSVQDGYYGVRLGSVTPFPEDLFAAGSRWLAVSVGSVEMGGRTELLPVPVARTAQSLERAAAPPLACDQPSHVGRIYYDTALQAFRGCDSDGWGSLGGLTPGQVPSGGQGTVGDPGRSCLDIHQAYPNLGSGLYYIDPDGDGATVQVQCDMSRAGGGWTFGVKAWQGAGIHGQQGAVGSVSNALTLEGAAYKLADQTIRDIIGSSNNFDLLADQAGHNTAYSSGNYEYVVLENYTGFFTFGSMMVPSLSPTTFKSYRQSDGALAWTGYLGCGSPGESPGSSTFYGINCYTVQAGASPNGGSGCSPNMGTSSDSGWHHFRMSTTDGDTQLYICNGAQHSSGYAMNHRFWFRERQPPRTTTIGTQGDPGRTCKHIHTVDPTLGDGVYWIDPESNGSPIQAQCDMSRAGGGWTFGLKSWSNAGIAGTTGAVGSVSDALTLKGGLYKLSDDDLRDIIGPSNNFDVLADQMGHNTAYSSGNYEYVTIENYTGSWRFDILMPDSTTVTTFKSFRARDHATAWTGRLACGTVGSVNTGSRGINCLDVVSNNPAGGSGCAINLGTSSDAGWHHFYMSNPSQDSQLYFCNGAQHSSGYNMNHRFWFRERS